MRAPLGPLPPAPARLLLRLLVPRRHRGAVLDDLAEEFGAKARTAGPRAARRWYWGQLRRSLAPALQMRTVNRTPAWRAGLVGLAIDVRQGLRRLLRAPAASLTILATLALGLGVNSAVFVVVHDVLLRPLPYPRPDRLVHVSHVDPAGDDSDSYVSWATWLHARENASGLADGGVYQSAVVNLTDGVDDAERIRLTMASAGVFRALGTAAEVGRVFRESEEDNPDAELLILSHGLWSRRYGADPGVVGRTVDVNSTARRVVGVMPAEFAFPDPVTDAWLLLPRPRDVSRLGGFYLRSVARLAEGSSAEGLRQELDRVMPRLLARLDAGEGLAPDDLRARVRPLHAAVVDDVGGVLWPVYGTVALVLALACTNVAVLLLVQAERTARETAVRHALGASRAALIRSHLIETMMLGAGAAVMGSLVAAVAVRAFLARAPAAIPRLAEVAFEPADAAYLAALTLSLTLVLGAVASRAADPVDAVVPRLRDGTRGASRGPRRRRLHEVAVTAQIAAAMVLLVGAALMARSFSRLTAVDPGFDATGVLTMDISLPFAPYNGGRETVFFNELLAQARALSGVVAAGAVTHLPLAAFPFSDRPAGIRVAGREAAESPPTATVTLLTPGYLEALRIPVVEGFGPAASEISRHPRPVLLSRSLARRLFPEETAIGGHLRRQGEDEGNPWATVVGVVAPVHGRGLDRPPDDVLYVPVLERSTDPEYSPGFLTLTVRAASEPRALIAPIRDLVRRLDPAVPVSNVRVLDELVAASIARRTLATALLVGASGLALLLAAVGLYGVVAHGVGARTREIGVRLALGADPAQIRRMVLRESLALVLVGVAAGGALAVALGRGLASLLYEVAPGDPLALGAAAVGLTLVATAATLVPARRAVRVDPVRALAAD